MLYKIELKSKNKYLLGKAMLLWGIVSAMPIVKFFSVTAFVWGELLFFGFLLIEVLKKGRGKFSKNIEKLYCGFVIIAIISTVASKFMLPPVWQEGWFKSLLQFIILFLFYIYYSNEKKSFYLEKFIKGVYYSSLIQLFWGIAQYILFKMGVDLNKLVFTDILHMMKVGGSQGWDGSIKISGFCWNAGNFAPLVLFGLAYTNNVYLKFLFILVSVLSGSRTLMIGVVIYVVFILLFKLKDSAKIKRNNFFALYVLIVLCVVSTPLIIDKMLELSGIINKIVTSIFDFKTNGSNLTHLYYYTNVIKTTVDNKLFNNIFGFGVGCSGYAYPHASTAILGEKWTIESDYINCLWSFGYVGFILYYSWFLNNMKKIKNGKCIVFLIAFLIEGVMYNVNWDWMKLLIISIFILNRNKIDCFKQNN